MPAEVTENPPTISCVFSRGAAAAVAAESGVNDVLAAQLLRGLADLVHPHGPLDTVSTVRHYVHACQSLVREVTAAGHRGGAERLTRGRLAEFWWSCGHRVEANSRRVLAALDDSTGLLSGQVRALVQGRVFNPAPSTNPLPPYTENEWAMLRRTCREIVREAFAEHRRALAAADAAAAPAAAGWSYADVCRRLAGSGPRSAVDLHSEDGHPPKCSGADLERVNRALFPATDTVIAYVLLFTTETGIVPDGITGLRVSDVDWAGGEVSVVTYHKGRASTESITLTRRASTLLRQWLRHSALSRRFAPEDRRDGMWLRHNAHGGRRKWFNGRLGTESFAHWALRRELVTDDGDPLRLNRQRLRTTFEVLRNRRAWIGSPRAMVDPNHTPQVEGDRYLSVSTEQQRALLDGVIAEAQGDLLRRAEAPRVLDADQLAAAAAGLPDAVAQADGGRPLPAGLVDGTTDAFAAACIDPLAGAHGPAGEPCPARPWVCLLCPLAIFAPRHAANLLRLRAYFARQWQEMPGAEFAPVFGPYARRVDDVIEQLRQLAPAELAAAARTVTDQDAELPLRPEERTS